MLLRPRLLLVNRTTVTQLPQRHNPSQWLSRSASPRLHAHLSHSHHRHDPNQHHHHHHQHRSFTNTPRPSQQPQSHYDILGVSPSTSPPELKKRFYALSKTHHPDLHPTDKTAVQKFQQISESYSVLSDPDRRRRYDRDVLHLHHQHRQNSSSYNVNDPQQQRGGTYAGSRAPTGLSKRRSAFRGPPPSYFRHGQGGSYDPNVNPSARASSSANTAYDGHNYTGPGGGGSGTTYDPDAPDFDARPVYKTQTAEDSRRNARRAAALAEAQEAAEADGDFWARFVIVTGVLLVGVTVGGLIVGRSGSGRGSGVGSGGLVKGDGTRREREKK